MQFRKSKKLGPLRFTLTQRGISVSVKVGPFTWSVGADGRKRRTVRYLPGVWETKEAK